MAWADEIAEQNLILASNQKNLDWLQGNTATFHTGSSEEPIERTAAGAVGYMKHGELITHQLPKALCSLNGITGLMM
tara:strand:+ start:2138 stop:2368 length:231 start_codon:yes stop_codon:yes gene_type:complete